MTDATKSLISKISDRYKEKTNEKSKTRDSSGFNRYDVNYILLCLFLCVALHLQSTSPSTVIAHQFLCEFLLISDKPRDTKEASSCNSWNKAVGNSIRCFHSFIHRTFPGENLAGIVDDHSIYWVSPSYLLHSGFKIGLIYQFSDDLKCS